MVKHTGRGLVGPVDPVGLRSELPAGEVRNVVTIFSNIAVQDVEVQFLPLWKTHCKIYYRYQDCGPREPVFGGPDSSL